MTRSSKTRPGQARFLLLAGLVSAALLALPVAAANPIKVYGVEMPSWSKKVGEDRYQSPRGWEKSVKHFKDQFRGWRSIKWHTEVNLPSVKYVHIENTNKKADWAGINIYELPGGKSVRVFVLKREKPPADAPAKADKKSASGK